MCVCVRENVSKGGAKKACEERLMLCSKTTQACIIHRVVSNLIIVVSAVL